MTDMIRVSSTEFGKEVGRYQDMALGQPVMVTRNGRDRTVMISAAEYGSEGPSIRKRTVRNVNTDKVPAILAGGTWI